MFFFVGGGGGGGGAVVCVFFQVPPSCINFPVPTGFVFDVCIFCSASFIYYRSVN